MLRERLPLNTILNLTIPAAITPQGINQVCYALSAASLPSLPGNWNWNWVVSKGEYAGTLPKRISSYYHKVHQLRLDQQLVATIGNTARMNSDEGTNYVFDFTDRFDWRSGDFGDSCSCYWGDRSDARDMLTDNEALAIRFYMNGAGFGRAWLVPDFPDDDMLTIFNAYPKNFRLITVARVLATYLGLSYKAVDLCNDGDTDGTLYINSGSGYIVGPDEVIQHYSDLDFSWEDYGGYKCDDCGCHLRESDRYHFDGYDYCESCYNDHVKSCDRCDRETWRSEIVEVHSDGYVQDWCQRCADHYAFTCDYCGEVTNEDECHTADGIASDYHYCDRCQSHFADCEECGCTFAKGDLNENHLCEECAEDAELQPVEVAVLVAA